MRDLIEFIRRHISAAENTRQETFVKWLDDLKSQLRVHHPQLVVLHHLIAKLLAETKGCEQPTQNDLNSVLESFLHREKEAILEGSKFIMETSPARIVTISHSSTVIGAIAGAENRGDFGVVVLESCPQMEGRILAEKLRGMQIKARVVADCAMGVVAKGDSLVLVGMDQIADVSFLNKAGTLPLLLGARYFDAASAVIGSTNKIVTSIRDEEWSIDSQPSDQSSSPIFDTVPVELVKAIICERGTIHSADWSSEWQTLVAHVD